MKEGPCIIIPLDSLIAALLNVRALSLHVMYIIQPPSYLAHAFCANAYMRGRTAS